MIPVTILAVTDKLNGAVLRKLTASIQSVVDSMGGIIGELVAEPKESLHIDLNKASHLIKSVKYNEITETIMCDIQVMSTPHGLHLQHILDVKPQAITWVPIFVYDDSKDVIESIEFLTVHAKYTKVK
jgi:hypothetical protein